MLKEMLFDATRLPLLKLGLDTYSLRHRAIADNVANAETPGYQRKQVVFEEKLQKALEHRDLQRTHSRHMSIPRLDMSKLAPELKLDKTASDVNDVSNVDIDLEMADLAKTHLQFSFSAHLAKLFYEGMLTSIRGV
ncbi:flagellar basal body rod protein FlgB [bacterium]|nr:flagellar basal body rod protein FlgB [bacterium]